MNEEQPITFEDTQDFQNFFDKKETKPQISYLGQLAILVGLVGAGLIVGSLIAALIFILFSGGGLTDMPKQMLDPKFANLSKAVQLIASVIMFFVPVWAYAAIVSKKPLDFIGFNKKISYKQVGLVICIAVAGLFLSGALAELNQIIPISKKLALVFKKWEDDYANKIMVMANMKNFAEYLFSMLVIALAPAIVEEALFRGGMQQILVKWTKNAWVGILITSIIFSAIHVSYYGFLSRLMLGMVLGFVFYYSKNIWLNILIHFLNNGISITALYLTTRHTKLSKEVLDDDVYPIWMGIIALPLIIGLLWQFKKESDKLNNEIIIH